MTSRTFKRTVFGGALGIALVSLVAVGTSIGQPRGPEGMREHRRGGPRLDALELTAQQKTHMQELRTDQAKKMARLKADVAVARIELEELFRTQSPSDKAVNQAVQKLQDAQGRMLAQRVSQRVAMQKILTAEQFVKLKEMGPGPRGREGRPGGPMGGGRGRGDGPRPMQRY